MNGIIVINKPRDFTSFDVVAKSRGILKTRKIGHGGTLDPLATGVLPLFLGCATKAVDLAPCDQKRYTATVRTGITTDSGDITGSVTERFDAPSVSSIERAVKSFLGSITQTVPMYSAVQINGRRLYDIARTGAVVERPKRDIVIEAIELLDCASDRFVIDVRCSKGTYIRTLAEDICRAAGSGGTIEALCRTESGGFTLDDCIELSELKAAAESGNLPLLPVERVFSGLPKIELDARRCRLFLNGVRLEVNFKDGVYAVYSGGFLAVASVEGGVIIKKAAFLENANQ